MKMVALPTGKQRSIHGPAVNVPSKVDTICDVLPRLPSQTEMVLLKLKRKVAYRGHYMYDLVTPQKPLDALRFLKTNNPLYCDIEINDQRFEEAIANDDELGMSKMTRPWTQSVISLKQRMSLWNVLVMSCLYLTQAEKFCLTERLYNF